VKAGSHRWVFDDFFLVDDVYVPYCILGGGGDEEDIQDACYFQAREHVLQGNFRG
jgi:hypothetical protein